MVDDIKRTGMNIDKLDPNLTYLNWRSRRRERLAWSIEQGGLMVGVASVANKKSSVDVTDLTLNISVRIQEPGEIKDLSFVGQETGENFSFQISADRQSAEVQMQIKSPTICRVSQNRNTVTLNIVSQNGSTTQNTQIAVDERCLLGDLPRNNVPDDIATLATFYAHHDPVIEALVKSTPSRYKTIEQRVAWLKSQLNFTDNIIQYSPPIGFGFAGLSAYALSPTETLRYGGECQDWTIFTGAYFMRLGHQTQVGFVPGHVWTRIITSEIEKGYYDLDLRSPGSKPENPTFANVLEK